MYKSQSCIHHLLPLCQDTLYSRKYEVEQLWRWCDSAPDKQMKRIVMASPDQDCNNWDTELQSIDNF